MYHVSNDSAREDFIICDLPFKRSSLSILPQEPILFTGTLRDNLDQWGKENDEKVVFQLVDVIIPSDWLGAFQVFKSFHLENL